MSGYSLLICVRQEGEGKGGTLEKFVIVSPSYFQTFEPSIGLSYNIYHIFHVLFYFSEDGAAFPGLFDHSSITTEISSISTESPTTPVVAKPSKGGCFQKGNYYADGASIESEDPCEHCYCMKGDIVCAVEPCMDGMEGDSESCKPQPPNPGECCPKEYKCGKLFCLHSSIY